MDKHQHTGSPTFSLKCILEHHHSPFFPKNINDGKTGAPRASHRLGSCLLCCWPGGKTAAQTLHVGGQAARGEKAGFAAQLRPKRATRASAAPRKYCALQGSTGNTSDDACPIHPDLKRCLKCSQLPVETPSCIKQGLALTHRGLRVPLLEAWMHIQNMHTRNCRLLPAAKEVFSKSLPFLQTLQPHKAQKPLAMGTGGLPMLKMYFREECLEGELLVVVSLGRRKRHFIQPALRQVLAWLS